MLKSKYDKKEAKDLCGDPSKACKKAKAKGVCGQLNVVYMLMILIKE